MSIEHTINATRRAASGAVKEIKRLDDEIARLKEQLAIADEAAAINAQDAKDRKAVVDAAREKCQEIILDDPVEAFLGGVRAGVARKILRTLDGEL